MPSSPTRPDRIPLPEGLTDEQRQAAEELAAKILANMAEEEQAPPPVELSPDAATTWNQLRTLQTQRAGIDEIIESLKERLRGLGRATYTIGGKPQFIVRPNTRFSARKAEGVLTPDELARCMRPMVDAKLAAEALPPERYRACQDEVGVDVVAPVQKKRG